MLAVSLKQVLSVPDSNHHGVEFIRIKRRWESGKITSMGS
jgi:hypothetical protein